MKCEKFFTTTIDQHIRQERDCTICNPIRKFYNLTLFLERAKAKYLDRFDYSLISPEDVEGNRSIVSIKTNCCGYVFKTAIVTFLEDKSDRQCDKCINRLPWSTSKLQERSKLKEDKYDYSLINYDIVYTNKSEIPIICRKCKDDGLNWLFYMTIHAHFSNNKNCPKCSECFKSKGSQEVKRVLEKIGINFEEEASFPEFYKYSYDYSFIYLGILTIFEYDGLQHFVGTLFFHKENGSESFEKARARDINKQKIALEKGYHIIRIDYTVPIDHIETYIRKGLRSEERVYYSHPELYGWLINS